MRRAGESDHNEHRAGVRGSTPVPPAAIHARGVRVRVQLPGRAPLSEAHCRRACVRIRGSRVPQAQEPSLAGVSLQSHFRCPNRASCTHLLACSLTLFQVYCILYC